MIILGVILLVLGFLLGISVLLWIGVALIIIGALLGALLWALSAAGRPIGGRPYRYY